MKETTITIRNSEEGVISTITVEQLSLNCFRMIENSMTNCDLTLGTEFETRLNIEYIHEVNRIVKESDFITRRFFLSSKLKEPDYQVLGDELTRHGGYRQVDFRSIATINIPKGFEFDIDQVNNDLGLNLVEII